MYKVVKKNAYTYEVEELCRTNSLSDAMMATTYCYNRLPYTERLNKSIIYAIEEGSADVAYVYVADELVRSFSDGLGNGLTLDELYATSTLEVLSVLKSSDDPMSELLVDVMSEDELTEFANRICEMINKDVEDAEGVEA